MKLGLSNKKSPADIFLESLRQALRNEYWVLRKTGISHESALTLIKNPMAHKLYLETVSLEANK